MIRRASGVTYQMLVFFLFLLALYGAFHLLQDVASQAQARGLSGTQTSALLQVEENEAVPTLLNYSSAQYGPLENRFGTYTMTFSIYITSSNEQLWSETLGGVEVRGGQFSVLLGETNPLSPTLFSEPHLEIGRIAENASGIVPDDSSPRSPIASVPYAHQAFYAQNADFATISDHASSADIATGAVNTQHIAANAVTSANIADGTILSEDLANGTVTLSKIRSAPSSSLQILTSGNSQTEWQPFPSDGLIDVQVLQPRCSRLDVFNQEFVKLLDIGAFMKREPDSMIEITFNGRIAVTGNMDGTGARFELRTDNRPSSIGPARAIVRKSEVGGDGVQASMTGLFSGLTAGQHTVSIWVAGANSSGTSAMVDPGCWSSDHVVVREIK